jgi:hypothetical protein
VLDRVNRRDRFSIKKPFRSSSKDASFHTKQTSNANVVRVLHTYVHKYHSRFIPEGVAEVSEVFLRDTHVLPKLVVKNTAVILDANSYMALRYLLKIFISGIVYCNRASILISLWIFLSALLRKAYLSLDYKLEIARKV